MEIREEFDFPILSLYAVLNGLAAEAFAIEVTEAQVQRALAFLQDHRFHRLQAIKILGMQVDMIDGRHDNSFREFKLTLFGVVQNLFDDIRALETSVRFLFEV